MLRERSEELEAARQEVGRVQASLSALRGQHGAERAVELVRARRRSPGQPASQPASQPGAGPVYGRAAAQRPALSVRVCVRRCARLLSRCACNCLGTATQ
eukprot:COSAG01_NODE_4242_length_5211_cov_24.571401_5_plen_100_part_00